MGDQKSFEYNEEIMETDYRKLEITEEVRASTINQCLRVRGNVRLATGRFYTDQEYEEKRRRAISRPSRLR